MEYLIIPTEAIDDEMFEFSVQKSRETLRYSVDGAMAVLKHSFDRTPGVFDRYRTFTHTEIRHEMAKPEWNKPEIS